jgi:hypothetical protein
MKRLLCLITVITLAIALLPASAQTGISSASEQTTSQKKKHHRRHHKSRHKGHINRDRYPQG